MAVLLYEELLLKTRGRVPLVTVLDSLPLPEVAMPGILNVAIVINIYLYLYLLLFLHLVPTPGCFLYLHLDLHVTYWNHALHAFFGRLFFQY